MTDIQYNRAGITARDPATGLRYQLARRRNGELRPTQRAQNQLPDGWLDFMISIPTTERQVDTGAHPVGPPRDTYTTFSESDYPGMEALLASFLPPGTNLAVYLTQPGAVLPQEFKDEFLQLVDLFGNGVVQKGSDREWDYRDDTWHVSVLRMEGQGRAARLVADLDRPMNGTVLVCDDIPCNWAMDPLTFTEKDCVALQLAANSTVNQHTWTGQRMMREACPGGGQVQVSCYYPTT